MYEITINGEDVFEYNTEKLLSHYLGSADARSVAERLAGDIAPGELFWTRTDGAVLIRRQGLLHEAAELDLEYWFPRRRTARPAT